MRLLTILLLLGGISTFCSAQRPGVYLSTNLQKRPNESNLQIFAKNNNNASVTVVLRLENARYRLASDQLPVIKILKPSASAQLITLFGITQNPNMNSTYMSGCLNTDPDELVYMLPIAQGKETKAHVLENLGEKYFGKEAPENWEAFAFTAVAGDTIFAARRGVVIDIEENKSTPDSENVSYAADRNYLTIEHADCTRGRYEMFAKNGVFPSVGETVEAGEALGTIASGKAYSIGDHVRFSVYYPKFSQEDLLNYRSNSTTPIKVHYVSVNYELGEGQLGTPADGVVYSGRRTFETLTQELTKGQIKKLQKAGKL